MSVNSGNATMKIGYMRVSKVSKPKEGEEAKNSQAQSFDMQRDALIAAGVAEANIYDDRASGKKDDRIGLTTCLKALRKGDTLVVWRLDRLGRNLKHLIETIEGLREGGIDFQCLTGLQVDTSTPTGRFMFQVIAALGQYERDLIRERIMAGLEAARVRGRNGGRRHVFTPQKLKMAAAAMRDRDTRPSELCRELGVSSSTLYKYISPGGELTERGRAFLA